MELPWRIELSDDEVMARFRWARRRGHPDYLWPNVAPADWRAALGELERITAAVLHGEPATLAATDPATARALGVAGYTTGLGPLAAYWLETGELEADEVVQRVLRPHLAHGRARADRLRSVLRQASDALARSGIRPLVVKGSHTAHGYFPEPGTRPALDVDLVVTRGEIDTAERELAESGHILGVRERRPRKSTWLAPGASRLPRSLEMLHVDSQYAVELHESLERNFFGVRTLEPGTPEAVPSRALPELDARVRVLRQPALLLYHALHASEGLYHLTLLRVVELVLMIRKDQATGELDWHAFRALLARHDAARFVYPAFAMVERLAPDTVEPATFRVLESAATPVMRRVIGARSPGQAWRLDTLSLDEKFMWCATPLEHVRRAVHMAILPSSGRWARRLAEKYVERVFRIARRTVALGSSDDDSGS